MNTPKNIFGDLAIPSRSVGARPRVILALGDSIPTGWFEKFYGELPGVVGMDDNLLQGILGFGSGGSTQPPAGPGAFVSHYETYGPNYYAGSATLAANASIGATSVSINYVAGGYAQTGMK